MTELRGGQLDAIMDVPFNQIATLDADPKLVAAVTPQLGVIGVPLNIAKVPAFHDPNVVKAIELRDRPRRRSSRASSSATPSRRPRRSTRASYFHTDKFGYSFDLAKAKSLMAKSKYPKGFTVTFSPPAGDRIAGAIATIMQSELKQIGITLKISPVDQTTAFERLQKQQFQMSYTYGTSDNLEPNSNMLFCCVSDGGAKSGYTGWVDKDADALYHKTQGELNTTERGEQLDQWQQIIMDKRRSCGWSTRPTASRSPTTSTTSSSRAPRTTRSGWRGRARTRP